MLSYSSTTEEDRLIIALACAIKFINIEVAAADEGPFPRLNWADTQVTGAAAVLLALEAGVPTPSLFPNGNIGMPLALLHWRAHMASIAPSSAGILQANAELVARQMADGRPYLQGNAPGLADICAGSWIMPKQNTLSSNKVLDAWLKRLTTLAESGPESPIECLADRSNLLTLEKQGLLELNERDGILFVTSPLDYQGV